MTGGGRGVNGQLDLIRQRVEAKIPYFLALHNRMFQDRELHRLYSTGGESVLDRILARGRRPYISPQAQVLRR